MHRSIVISGNARAVHDVAERLVASDDVVSVTVHAGAARKPKGDVLVVEVLNRGADEVLRAVAAGVAAQELVVAIKPISTLIAAALRDEIEHDQEEVVWEEVEGALRSEGRLSPNYAALMVLGAAVAAAGLTFGPLMKVTAFIGASIVAPALEPVAKLTLGLVLRRWRAVRQGLIAMAVGYGSMIVTGALIWTVVRLVSRDTHALIVDGDITDVLSTSVASWVISLAAAAAGGIIVTSLRETIIIGPVIALVLVPGTTMIGAAAAVGHWQIVARASLRVGLDLAAVIGCCALVFLIKQRWRHRRRPVT